MTEVDKLSNWEDEINNIPAYTIADASRYLHIPLPTLRSWLKGRNYTTKSGKKEFLPLIQRPSTKYTQLSFTNLVEAHVLRVIRTDHKITLDKVRTALDYLSKYFSTTHPLVQKQFKTDGVNLFIEQLEHLIDVSRSGQLVIRETLENLLSRVEWDKKEEVARLFPLIRDDDESKVISIDPKVSFGKPTIAGTGVPTKIVTQRYDAGDSIEEIADDYNCQPSQVKDAIRFESYYRAA